MVAIATSCALEDEEVSYPEESTPVSREDVVAALKRLKNKKTAAADGLVAEMLKRQCLGFAIMELGLAFTRFFRVREGE